MGIAYYFVNTVASYKEGGFQLHGGGGLANVDTLYTVEYIAPGTSGEVTYSGSGLGTYISFGGRYVFSGGFTLGLNIRSSSSEFELECESSTAEDIIFYYPCDAFADLDKEDYGLRRTMLTLGYSWE